MAVAGTQVSRTVVVRAHRGAWVETWEPWSTTPPPVSGWRPRRGGFHLRATVGAAYHCSHILRLSNVNNRILLTRYIIFLLLLLCLAGCCLAAEDKSTRDDALRVTGPVQHVRVEDGSAEWDGFAWQDERREGVSWLATFTRAGKPLEVTGIYAAQAPPHKRQVVHETYQYNQRGQETRHDKAIDGVRVWQRVTGYSPTGMIAAVDESTTAAMGRSRMEYRYDANGLEISSRFFDTNNHLQTEELTGYTSTGEPSFEQVNNGSGVCLGETRYTYDAQGHLVKRAVLDGAGHPRRWTVTTYDAAGRAVGSAEYRQPDKPFALAKITHHGAEYTIDHFFLLSSGAVQRDASTTYAGEEQKVAETVYRYRSDGGLRARSVTRYDAQGRVIEEANYTAEATLPYTRRTFAFTADGNIEEEKEYSGRVLTHKTRWLYEYDRQHNWTKRYRREWVNGSTDPTLPRCAVTFRTLTYHGDPLAVLSLFQDTLCIHPERRLYLWLGGGGCLLLLIIGVVRRRRRMRGVPT